MMALRRLMTGTFQCVLLQNERLKGRSGHLESWCRRMWTLVILLPLAVGLPQSQLELKLEKSEDFVIGSSCAVEAFSPQGNLDLSKLEG